MQVGWMRDKDIFSTPLAKVEKDVLCKEFNFENISKSYYITLVKVIRSQQRQTELGKKLKSKDKRIVLQSKECLSIV